MSTKIVYQNKIGPKKNKIFLIKRRRGDGRDLNSHNKSPEDKMKKSVAIKNLLRVREEINWRASKMAKYFILKEEKVGGKVLEKEMCDWEK